MGNPFKNIDKPLKQPPKQLKNDVMKDIAMAKLLIGITSVFSINLGHVFEETLKKKKHKSLTDG